MSIIEKLERAIALAKELGLNDQQVQELVSLILGLPVTRVNYQFSQPQSPVFPFVPNDTPQWPLNDHTIICMTPS